MSRLLAALCLGLTAPVLAGIPENRARWIGPEVAKAPTFTVHVVSAERRGAAFACPKDLQGNQVVQTREDQMVIWKQREDYVRQNRGPLDADHQRKMDENQRQMSALAPKVRRGEITREEFQRRFDALRAEQEALNNQHNEAEKKLYAEAEKKYPFATGGKAMTLHLQHAPRSPDELIIPLAGENPAPAFTNTLNETLAPFLSTCGSMSSVLVLHYYRDAERRGANAEGEQEVLRNLYALQNGRLALQAKRELSADNPFKLATHDDMTLAGFRRQDARVRRINADYRTDFEYASRRKPGVVYKYDEFWKQYPDFEIGRRIFDGDFENYVDTIDFAFLYTNYGDSFTSQCRAQVKKLTRLFYPTRTYVGGETNPVDLTFEPKYEDGVGYFDVDSRFADRLPEFTREQQKYMLKKWLEKQNRGEHFSWTMEGFRKGVHDVLAEGKIPPMLKFFSTNTCTSPVMQQLGENIDRAARKQPSLQATGMRIADAERASDAPRKP